MTMIRRFVSMLAVALLAACGGGGGNEGSSPFGGGGGGGGTPTGPQAADLTLTLSTTSVNNTGTEAVTATATAVDVNRNTVAGIPVTVTVDNDATVLVSGTATDSSGVVSGTIGIGANKANRTITVTATSGSIVRALAFQVVGTKLTATALPAVIAPSAAGKVQYRLVDANGNPMSGATIAVTGPGGVVTQATTGTNGDYEYNYTSPSSAGTLDLLAAAAGVNQTTSVIVQGGSGAIPPVPAGSVRSASVRANPSVVSVNTSGGTTNRSEIRALFVGDSNAPIKNVRVRFDLAGDVNSIGGTFTTAGTIVYSDDTGVAQTAYVPGTRFSPTDGVTIRACWDYVDFADGTCPNETAATPMPTRTTLTVISDALSVTIGTDETILVEDLTYVKRFVVQVNDSSGLAKPDVAVSPLLDLSFYSKGFWTRPVDKWVQTVTTARCDNEDVNRNGVLETYSNGHQEDANANGQLDPRKADVILSFEGSSRTNAAGQVKLRLTYPRNFGSWLGFSLTVAAGGVTGTEGRATYSSVLPVAAAAVSAESPPAFVVSPYGIAVSPKIVVTTPDGSASGSLCTDKN